MARRTRDDGPGLFGDSDGDAGEPARKSTRASHTPGADGPLDATPADAEGDVLAARIGPRIRLGTSSWTFPGWIGTVYAREHATRTLARTGLREYAHHRWLRTVGIDRTFYRPIADSDYRSMAAQVPQDFRFLVKAHEAITRPDVTDASGQSQFLDAAYARAWMVEPMVAGLGDRAGPLLFQFSPMGIRGDAAAESTIRRIGEFLGQLPRGPLYAVEIRDAALVRPSWGAMLHDSGAVHCFSVHPSVPPLAVQARCAPPHAQRAIVCRWMLHGGFAYEEARARYEPFDRIMDPDPASLQGFASLCAQATAHGMESWVIVNNKAEGSAPLSVLRLARAIADRMRDQRTAGADGVAADAGTGAIPPSPESGPISAG
jgi:uncharacterized protein YecE (DUF72 family)